MTSGMTPLASRNQDEEEMQHKVVTFALTRGYRGLSKVRYVLLIRRNLALRQAFRDSNVTHLIFHEGNISRAEQVLIQLVSRVALVFTDVSSIFVVGPNQLPPTGSKRDVGYRLMCRFQYADVWSLLQDYDFAYRIDEDCVIKSVPKPDSSKIFLTGGLSEETHEESNKSLYNHLSTQGLGRYYDHKFPYTNCYLTRVSFWLEKPVQEFVQTVARHERALVDRWGDLPVLGVALKAYGAWDSDRSVSADFEYFHQSHNSIVRLGSIVEVEPTRILRILRMMARVSRWLAKRDRP